MPKRKKPLVLVAGGAGFIGSNVVNHLLAHGFSVRVMDALIAPTHNGKLPPWFNTKAEFLRGDVRKKRDWVKGLRGADYVIHLAAYADVHPEYSRFIETNITSAGLLYEIIREKNLPIRKAVFASSQSVYGEGHYHCRRHGAFLAAPRREADLLKRRWDVRCPKDRSLAKPLPEREEDTLAPLNVYGVSKLGLEKTALLLGQVLGIPTVILRYSIAHGPYQSFRNFYSGALRAFAVAALAGEVIETQEDGRQLRDFVHVSDVAEAHRIVLRNPKADFQVLNVGYGKPVSVMTLARAVAKAAKAQIPPRAGGAFRGLTPRHSVMDVSKLKRLGWRPKRTLEENVRDYLNWIRRYPEAIRHMQKTYRDMAKSGYIRKAKNYYDTRRKRTADFSG